MISTNFFPNAPVPPVTSIDSCSQFTIVVPSKSRFPGHAPKGEKRNLKLPPSAQPPSRPRLSTGTWTHTLSKNDVIASGQANQPLKGHNCLAGLIRNRLNGTGAERTNCQPTFKIMRSSITSRSSQMVWKPILDRGEPAGDRGRMAREDRHSRAEAESRRPCHRVHELLDYECIDRVDSHMLLIPRQQNAPGVSPCFRRTHPCAAHRVPR